MNDCELEYEQLKTFYQGLMKCKTLNVLNLKNNNLDHRAGNIIGKIISAHGQRKDETNWLFGLRGEKPEQDLNQTGIFEICLMNNKISDAGCHDICSFLKYDSWLKDLNLRHNFISQKGVEEFLKLFKRNESLLNLDLRDNKGFNRKASEQVLQNLSNNLKKFKKMLAGQKRNPKGKKMCLGEEKTHLKNSLQMHNEIKESEIEEIKSPFLTQKLKIPQSKPRFKHQRKKSDKMIHECPNCKILEKKFLKSESKAINLCIENSKLKNALPNNQFLNSCKVNFEYRVCN